MARLIGVAALVLAVACGATPVEQEPTSTTLPPTSSTSAASTTNTVEATSTTVTPTATPTPLWRLEVEGAVSMNVVASPGHRTTVAWIGDGIVALAGLDVGGGRLVDTTAVNGDVEPIAHPIERPAVAIRPDGAVDVAFTSFQGSAGSVFTTTWQPEGSSEPTHISGEPQPETNLVHITHDAEGNPVLAWLEDSTLSVAHDGSGGLTEVELVDDQTCDCCNPVPLFIDGELVVAYRDLVPTGDAPWRDVALVRSADGGQSFDAPVTIADDHWAIAGCPFTGPTVANVDGELVVAWMDARQSVHPDQDSSTIWVDRSSDGGRTFGADLALTAGGIHRWPVMAVDDDLVIHLVWQTQGADGGLSYTTSSDGGHTFDPPVLLVGSDGGSPQAPSIAIADGHMVVTWVGGGTGHVAAWPLSPLAG